MTRPILLAALLAVLALPAHAQCFADYKAKQDNPLRLHYGVAQISSCGNKKAARAELAPRLAAGGWKLLNIVSIFGPEGLNERQSSAGAYFLRY